MINITNKVISFRGISDRVAELTLRINYRYQITLVQVYLPTTDHPDEEVESVYEDIGNIISRSKSHYNIVMGDFNAKVGKGKYMEISTRPFGLEPRNWRGDMLVEFVEHHNFKILNTFFKKRLHQR